MQVLTKVIGGLIVLITGGAILSKILVFMKPQSTESYVVATIVTLLQAGLLLLGLRLLGVRFNRKTPPAE